MNHSLVGGVSSTTTSIGFSPGWNIPDKVEFARGIECGVKEPTYPVIAGRACEEPSSSGTKTHQDKDQDKDPLSSDAHHSLVDIATREFAVPSVFTRAGWVRRTLSTPEILSVLDTPSGIIKAIDRKMSLLKGTKLEEIIPSVVPLKTLQEVTRILFAFENISYPFMM